MKVLVVICFILILILGAGVGYTIYQNHKLNRELNTIQSAIYKTDLGLQKIDNSAGGTNSQVQNVCPNLGYC